MQNFKSLFLVTKKLSIFGPKHTFIFHCGPVQLKNIPIEKLYSRTRPVSGQKNQDMMDLCQLIPPAHHRFFLNLVTALEEEEEDIGPLPYV